MSAPALSSQVASGPKEPSFQSGWFGSIPNAIILAAVVLFVAGWNYLYGFYSAFGLSLDEAGFSIQETMIFAARVVVWGPIVTILILAPLLGVVVPILVKRYYWPTFQRVAYFVAPAPWSRMLTYPAAILVLAGLSWASIHRGRMEAAKQMAIETCTLPELRLVLDLSKLPAVLLPDVPKDGVVEGYRLLTHRSSGYFCFQPLRPLRASQEKIDLTGRAINVLFIPDKPVLGAQIGSAIP